jgi:hypothetical protein
MRVAGELSADACYRWVAAPEQLAMDPGPFQDERGRRAGG